MRADRGVGVPWEGGIPPVWLIWVRGAATTEGIATSARRGETFLIEAGLSRRIGQKNCPGWYLPPMPSCSFLAFPKSGAIQAPAEPAAEGEEENVRQPQQNIRQHAAISTEGFRDKHKQEIGERQPQ